MLFQIHSQLSEILHKAPCRLNEQYLLGAADNYFLKLPEVLHFYEIKC